LAGNSSKIGGCQTGVGAIVMNTATATDRDEKRSVRKVIEAAAEYLHVRYFRNGC
jgi:hypothetical protein